MPGDECCEPQAGEPMDAPEVATTSLYNDVKIQRVSNGFIVNVGCKTFVSQDWKEVSKGLEEYWKDPVSAEKKFCK